MFFVLAGWTVATTLCLYTVETPNRWPKRLISDFGKFYRPRKKCSCYFIAVLKKNLIITKSEVTV